jgi:hypothetical protein
LDSSPRTAPINGPSRIPDLLNSAKRPYRDDEGRIFSV